jgi:hypothetical protein
MTHRPAVLLFSFALSQVTLFGADPIRVHVKWDSTVSVLKTVPTVFVNPQPPGKPGPDEALRQIKELGARHMRFQPLPSPLTQVIPELRPPTSTSTSWDFTAMDAVTVPFLEAMGDLDPVVCIPETPQWMHENFDAAKFERESVLYETAAVDYDGLSLPLLKEAQSALAQSFKHKLIDPSGEQLAGYHARIVSWYTQGGFVDELGHRHLSGHRFALPWWEVLNEVQWEMTAEQYVRIYDAVVTAIREVNPATKFVGMGLGPVGLPGSEGPARDTSLKFFEYFLNPENHRPGIPLDMVSYHFYAVPAVGQTIEHWQYSLFDQGEAFLHTVAFLEGIRKRLSPATKVNISELGIILPDDFVAMTSLLQGKPDTAEKIAVSQSRLSSEYWNLSGALFAYLWMELSKQGIDVVTASELMVGNSRVFPSINLIDPVTGKPNARLQALRLLVENFQPGDRLVGTRVDYVSGTPANVAVQAFETSVGRKLLVINKRMHPVELDLGPNGSASYMDVVDEKSGGEPPRREVIVGSTVHLDALAVGVIALDAQ